MSGILLLTGVGAEGPFHAAFDCARQRSQVIAQSVLEQLATLASFPDQAQTHPRIPLEDTMLAGPPDAEPSWVSSLRPAAATAHLEYVSVDDPNAAPLTLLATNSADPVWGELTLRDEQVGFEVVTASIAARRVLNVMRARHGDDAS